MENKLSNDGHYQGFWIDWYDELLKDESRDLEYYGKLLSEDDAPVLELACGTGRIMEVLLGKNIETHGLDISGPMLNICRDKLKRQGFDPTLFQQSIVAMKLPQSYQTVICPGGSFQLVADAESALKALENIFQAIVPGGRFICDLWIPWDELISNEQNTWKTGRIAKRNDGSSLVVSYFKSFDHLHQVQSGYFKYELFQGFKLIDTHIDQIRLSWFGVNEFKLMLERAGFHDIWFQQQPIMSSHGISTVYIAKK